MLNGVIDETSQIIDFIIFHRGQMADDGYFDDGDETKFVSDNFEMLVTDSGCCRPI